MSNIANTAMLILYNPYYQSDVIEAHLEVLKREGKVYFGKVKSKMRDIDSKRITSSSIDSHADTAHSHAAQNSKEDCITLHAGVKMPKPKLNKPLQLFLSDYANLFVCEVVGIVDSDMSESSTDSTLSESSTIDPRYCPAYYEEKGLEVELWFEITDMRELVRNDFVCVRDKYLGQFSTIHNNRTFALYGNDYTYPLGITLKNPHNYFATRYIYKQGALLASKHYHDVFKTKEQQDTRQKLIDYVFGALADSMHPDTLDNLVNAEIEFHANKLNATHDCTGIALWFGKSAEEEINSFLHELLRVLIARNPRIAGLTQSVQERKFSLGDWVNGSSEVSINLGSVRHILREFEVKNAFDSWKNDDCRGKNKGGMSGHGMSRHDVWQFARFRLGECIESIQNVRNRAAHALQKGGNKMGDGKPKMNEIRVVREQILGIGQPSVLCEILRAKEVLR